MKWTLESALGGSSVEPHPGKDLNNEVSVLTFPHHPFLSEPENRTRRRIYLKGKKEVDTKTHVIPMDQNSPYQGSLSNVTMFSDLQKVI